jgi:3-oxoisoapionate decarboxylase
MQAGLNLEFARTDGLGLENAMRCTAETGYRFVEPYVYSDVKVAINSHLSLASVTPYHHVHTAQTDAAALNRLRQELGLQFSAVDAHASLLLPQFGVEYLKQAIDFAAEVECPIVMSDEGPVPEEWMSLDQSFEIMCITLEVVIRYAQSRGVRYAMELHNALTARPDLLPPTKGRGPIQNSPGLPLASPLFGSPRESIT